MSEHPQTLADQVADWDPPETTSTESITPWPQSAFAGLIEQPPPMSADNDPLPPLWHWLYFLEWPAQHELGPDGHPRDGHFLPPIPNRRRMFAGGRLTQHQPLLQLQHVTRTSAVSRLEVKQGSSGELLFVTVRHELAHEGLLLAVDEQDIVYRQGDQPRSAGTDASGRPAHAAPSDSDRASGVYVESPWRLTLTADPVLLFRFSALTHNAHRIHYDAPYTTDVEGFPGLLVHGPLLALLLLELPRRYAPGRQVTTFAFRAHRPVYEGQPVILHGGPSGETSCHLEATSGQGETAMTADATFAT